MCATLNYFCAGHRVMHFSQCKYTVGPAFKNVRKTKTMQVTVTILWDYFSRQALPTSLYACLATFGFAKDVYVCMCVYWCILLARITLELQSSLNIYTKHELYILIFFYCFCWFRVSHKKNYFYIVKCVNFYVFFVIRKSTFFRFLYTI